jgi:hypothetical protein
MNDFEDVHVFIFKIMKSWGYTPTLYFFGFGGLLSLPPPDGFPVVLGFPPVPLVFDILLYVYLYAYSNCISATATLFLKGTKSNLNNIEFESEAYPFYQKYN